MGRKVWHQCEGCGKRRKLPKSGSHWCDCSEVKFRMVWDKHRALGRKLRRRA